MASCDIVEYLSRRRCSGATLPVRFANLHGGSARIVEKPPTTSGSGGASCSGRRGAVFGSGRLVTSVMPLLNMEKIFLKIFFHDCRLFLVHRR